MRLKTDRYQPKYLKRYLRREKGIHKWQKQLFLAPSEYVVAQSLPALVEQHFCRSSALMMPAQCCPVKETISAPD